LGRASSARDNLYLAFRDVKPLRSKTVANGYCIDNLKFNLTLGVPKLGVERKRREKGRRERDRKIEREGNRKRKGLVGCPANPVAFATKVHSSYNQPPLPSETPRPLERRKEMAW
jgi:hypothetical protein